MKRYGKRALCLALALCLCVCLCAVVSGGAAAETEIGKVLIQTGQGGTTPVVWLELQYLPTKTSTNGVTIAGATWYTEAGEAITDKFGTETCYLVVRVTANEGYVFSANPMAFINNSEASVTRESDTALVITSHKYKPEIWAASPTKHPIGEEVEPGGWASFVAAGMYTQDYEWCLMSPDLQHRFTLKEAKEEATVTSREPNVPRDFADLTYSGEYTDKLILRNIPADMNGWFVYCRLYSVNRLTWTNTNNALVTVIQPSPTPAPTPEPTPEPTPSPEPSASPSPSPSAEPSPSATPSPTPEVHEHEPAADWSTDESAHWHACAGCDELLDKADHDFTWTETRPAALGLEGEEEGVCRVCGYKTTRSLPALTAETEPSAQPPRGSGAVSDPFTAGVGIDLFRNILFGAMGLTAVGLVALVIVGIVRRSQRRHRRRR